MNTLPKIVIVGAGRIAWNLGKRLKSKGLPIAQVVARHPDQAEALALALGCAWSASFQHIQSDARWVLMAVSDDAIGQVAAQLAGHLSPETLVTHTSGATPGLILSPHFERYGVFYPLQSFSLERQPVWSKIPFCVDASDAEALLFLKKTAKIIGNLVYQVNDHQRSVLHVAAVFANNFTNHCFAVAEKILDEADLSFEMLHPLMEETLAKAVSDSPSRMQTGPALRGDVDTLKKHVALLAQHPSWQRIYEAVSDDIIQQKKEQAG